MTNKRKQMQWAHTLSVVTRVLLFATLLLLVVIVLYFGQTVLVTDSLFQLKSVDFVGAKRFNQEAFGVRLSRAFGLNVLTLNLDEVRSLAEAETWVKSATVRRRLPDRMIVSLVERQPVAVAAIDNELFVVDVEGVVLDSFRSDYQFIDQPIVTGLKNVARENSRSENAQRMEAYFGALSDLRSESVDHAKTLSEIDVADPERVAVVPADDPVSVYLGSEGFRQRYETFLSQRHLYRKLKEKYGLIEYVDVTYEDKVIFHTPREEVSG